MDCDLFYSIEKEYNDKIFDSSKMLRNESVTIDDVDYNADTVRTYVFKDFSKSAYVVDNTGMVMNIKNKDLFHIKDMMKINFNRRGIVVIKSYKYDKINLNELLDIVLFLNNNETSLATDAKILFRNELNSFINNPNRQTFVFRMISFISEKDLLGNKKYFDYLLDGYLTMNLAKFNNDFYNEYNQGNNGIEIHLKDHDEINNYYMVIKNTVVPLYTSDTVKEDVIKIKKGKHVVREIALRDKYQDFNIFTSEREAKQNVDNYEKKNFKLNLEEKKLDVEDKKLNVELCKLAGDIKKLQFENKKLQFESFKLVIEKEKAILDYKKSIINFRIELIKKQINNFNIIKEVLKNGGMVKDLIKSIFVILKKGA